MSSTPSRTEIDSFKSLLAKKSDYELNEIIHTNAQKINILPSNASPSQLADARLWLAEVMACQEIVEDRIKEKVEQKAALETWKSSIPQRIERNILNLPAASSANGQLIAAILEDEDGKTAEEISGWCDELADLGLDECKSLLDQLVSEGILELGKDQKYYLLNICTSTLYPPNISTWAERQFKRKYRYSHASYTEKLIIAVLDFWKEPLTEDDLTAHIQELSDSELEALIENYPFLSGIGDVSSELRSHSIPNALHGLCGSRILTREFIYPASFVYFPMLGEK
jgi:hypothetical protein